MKKRKKNNFLLTDNKMAEFVSKGYLIFNNIIDNNERNNIGSAGKPWGPREPQMDPGVTYTVNRA